MVLVMCWLLALAFVGLSQTALFLERILLRPVSLLPHQVIVKLLVIDPDRTAVPFCQPKYNDLPLRRHSASVVLPLRDKDFVNLDDLSIAAETVLHPAILVLDEEVDERGDVAEVGPGRSGVQAGEQDGRLERDVQNETVTKEDERGDVQNSESLEDAAIVDGERLLLAAPAIHSREVQVLLKVQGQIVRTAAADVAEKPGCHQIPIKHLSPAVIVFRDFVWEVQTDHSDL